MKKSAILILAPHAGLPPQFFPPSLQFYAQPGQEKPPENGVSVSKDLLLIGSGCDIPDDSLENICPQHQSVLLKVGI